MDDSFRVTAVVSTYNSADFLPGCLDGLLEQTLGRALEIIVVDSGSQQNEAEIVADSQVGAPNIRFIQTPTRETIYSAWNRGAKAASAPFVVNANTDDRLRRDALERMCGAMEGDPECGAVYIDQIVTKSPYETYDDHTFYRNKIRDDFVPEEAARMNPCGPQVMWRKSLHDRIGYFRDDYEVAGDWDFWLRIAFDAGMKVNRLPELLGLYYLNMEGLECGPRKQAQRKEEIDSIRKRFKNRVIEAAR